MCQQIGKGQQGEDERPGENWDLDQHGARRAPGYHLTARAQAQSGEGKGSWTLELDSKTRTRWISATLARTNDTESTDFGVAAVGRVDHCHRCGGMGHIAAKGKKTKCPVRKESREGGGEGRGEGRRGGEPTARVSKEEGKGHPFADAVGSADMMLRGVGRFKILPCRSFRQERCGCALFVVRWWRAWQTVVRTRQKANKNFVQTPPGLKDDTGFDKCSETVNVGGLEMLMPEKIIGRVGTTERRRYTFMQIGGFFPGSLNKNRFIHRLFIHTASSKNSFIPNRFHPLTVLSKIGFIKKRFCPTFLANRTALPRTAFPRTPPPSRPPPLDPPLPDPPPWTSLSTRPPLPWTAKNFACFSHLPRHVRFFSLSEGLLVDL